MSGDAERITGNPSLNRITEGLPVIRPESMPSAEITSCKTLSVPIPMSQSGLVPGSRQHESRRAPQLDCLSQMNRSSAHIRTAAKDAKLLPRGSACVSQTLAANHLFQHIRGEFSHRGTTPARSKGKTPGTAAASFGGAVGTPRTIDYPRGIARQTLAGGHLRRLRSWSQRCYQEAARRARRIGRIAHFH